MRHPAVVVERPGAGKLAAEELRQLTQLREVFLALYAAASGHKHVALVYRLALELLHAGLQHDVVGIGLDLDALSDELAGRAGLGRKRLEHLRVHRDHLRALLENDDVAEYVAAEVRGGLHEYAVLVHVEVDGVGGQAGAKVAHHARSHVAPYRAGGEQEYARLVLVGEVDEHLLVGARAVVLQIRVLGQDDLLRAVGVERVDQTGDVVAQQHGRDGVRAAQLGLEVVRLGQQLKIGAGEDAVFLLGEHPYALAFFFSHRYSPPYMMCSASSTSAMALAMASGSPSKYLVSVLRLGGSKMRLLELGEPGMPIMSGSQPRSSAFQV